MSTRTIIEINHDFASMIEADPDQFMVTLRAYLRRPCSDTSALLRRYGVNVAWSGSHTEPRKLNAHGAYGNSLDMQREYMAPAKSGHTASRGVDRPRAFAIGTVVADAAE